MSIPTLNKYIPEDLVDIVRDFMNDHRFIYRHLSVKVKDKERKYKFLVGVTNRNLKPLHCESHNKDDKILMEDMTEISTDIPVETMKIFHKNVCQSCSRFNRFCICQNNKGEKLWYLRICDLPNTESLFMDITCTKACIFPHIIHLPLPKFLIFGLSCDQSICDDILGMDLLENEDPAVIHCTNREHHLNILF